MGFFGDENAIFCREMVWGWMGIRGSRGCNACMGQWRLGAVEPVGAVMPIRANRGYSLYRRYRGMTG